MLGVRARQPGEPTWKTATLDEFIDGGGPDDDLKAVGPEQFELLRSPEAYDVAYATIYRELPACRNCVCA